MNGSCTQSNVRSITRSTTRVELESHENFTVGMASAKCSFSFKALKSS